MADKKLPVMPSDPEFKLKPTFDHPFEQYAIYHGQPFELVSGPYSADDELLTEAEARERADADEPEDLCYVIRMPNGKYLTALIEEIEQSYSWGSNPNDNLTYEQRREVTYDFGRDTDPHAEENNG